MAAGDDKRSPCAESAAPAEGLGESDMGRVPRWKQREAIRARGGRRRSGQDASPHRPERDSDDGCVSGHPALFGMAPVFELGRMPEGGGYPMGFIETAAKLMGVQDLGEVVHLCSGSISARLTFDLRPTSAAAVRADVRELPIRSGSVRWVMADPPYDQEYAEVLWGMGKQYPTPTVLLREVARVLRPGGRVAFLHHVVPTLPEGLSRVGTWGVTTGTGYRIRALTVAERTGDRALIGAGAGHGEVSHFARAAGGESPHQFDGYPASGGAS